MKRTTTLITILILAALLAGCGVKVVKQPYSGSPETGLVVNYHLNKGDTYSYTTDNTQDINMEVMGNQQQMRNSFAADFTLAATGTDKENNYQTEITLDSLNMAVTGMQNITPDLSGLQGKAFNLTLSPKGETIDISNNEDLTFSTGQPGTGETNITTNIQNIFPNLPDKTISIGATWTETAVDTVKRMGMNTINDSETTTTFEGVETKMGRECLKIVSESTALVDGEGEQMGMAMIMEGDMETTRTVYFDYKKGVVVKMEMEGFMEGTVSMSGQAAMTIPIVMELSNTLELKEK